MLLNDGFVCLSSISPGQNGVHHKVVVAGGIAARRSNQLPGGRACHSIRRTQTYQCRSCCIVAEHLRSVIPVGCVCGSLTRASFEVVVAGSVSRRRRSKGSSARTLGNIQLLRKLVEACKSARSTCSIYRLSDGRRHRSLITKEVCYASCIFCLLYITRVLVQAHCCG